MNGPQDLGGKMGFGAVEPEPEDVRFHADWERRAFALTLASSAPGGWNLDMSRHARESLHPADYLSSSYYEIWLEGLQKLVLAARLVTPAELAEGRALEPAQPGKRVLDANMVPRAFRSGHTTERPMNDPARFAVGDVVRARNIHPTGHTRLPQYVRGRQGTVRAVHGGHVFPDAHAHGQGESPQWLYTVEFDGRELWGEGSDLTLSVSVDAWESYLEPA
jgi:nitrile hydratase subunit beta